MTVFRNWSMATFFFRQIGIVYEGCLIYSFWSSIMKRSTTVLFTIFVVSLMGNAVADKEQPSAQRDLTSIDSEFVVPVDDEETCWVAPEWRI